MADVQIRDTNVKITDILHLIGDGYSYEQITKKYPQMTLTDIMMSAKIAEEIIGTMVKLHGDSISAIKMEFVFKNNSFKSIEELQKTNPRAFAKWRPTEDANLVAMFKDGKNIKDIALILERTYGSIRARLEKFELVPPYQKD